MKDTQIQQWVSMYKSNFGHDCLTESIDKDEVLTNIFTSLLYFLNGEGDKVINDHEWANYVFNDIQNAITLKLFTPTQDDEKRIDSIKDKLYS